MNGCRSTIGQTWQRCKTLRRSGCGPTTTTAQTWPWAGSLLNSGWPWLRNVSTSATLAKGEDYLLTQAAHRAGLDTLKAQEVLNSDQYALEVRASEQEWQRAGIHSVPAAVVNRKYLISGGQPVEAFEQALRKIAQDSEVP